MNIQALNVVCYFKISNVLGLNRVKNSDSFSLNFLIPFPGIAIVGSSLLFVFTQRAYTLCDLSLKILFI